MSVPSLRFDRRSETMPRWAILERDYLKLASTAPEVLKDYLTEDGELLWPDCVRDFQTFAYGNVDNVFEGFQSFPLLYLVGGDEKLLAYSKRQYSAFVRQFSTRKKIGVGIAQEEAAAVGRDTLLVDGMFPELDWMHIGEANLFLYHLLLADPTDPVSREALMKCAVYCFDENPAGYERNYDPEYKVFKCPYFGANGPAYERFRQPYRLSRWMDFYGLPFYDVPGVNTYYDLAKEECAVAMGKVYEERLSRCDTITNLLSTSLAVNAYMISGDAHYRDFVLDYVGAWRKRGEGWPIMPDNAGPHGIVGETMGGRFYGSHYGYTLPHGYYFIEDALIVGGENERFFTRSNDSLGWARDLYNTLVDRYGIPAEGGGMYIPLKRADEGAELEFVGDPRMPHTSRELKHDPDPRHVRFEQVDGWYEFGYPEQSHWGHIYAASHSHEDAARMEQILSPEKLRISYGNIQFSFKYKGGQHGAYTMYLEGKYPTYPEDIMSHSIDQFYHQVADLETEKKGITGGFGYQPDNKEEWQILKEVTAELNAKTGLNFSESTVHAYYQQFLLKRTPLSLEGMLQLTMGAMFPVYNGGLIQAQVRYFDPANNRPGLPEGVAALVSSITDEGITLTLANTDLFTARTLIMQGGAYGEHDLLSITVNGETTEVGGRWAEITIGAGCVVEMTIAMKRYANEPSLEEPVNRA